MRPELRADPLKVLVFTTVFPSPGRPVHGTFVLERLQRLTPFATMRVVAPVPRFPWSVRTPSRATSGGLPVEHPTFFYIPGLLKPLDGLLLFLSSLACVMRLRRSFDFDLIDAHFAFPDGFAAILLGWWFRRQVTITLRGTLLQLSAYPLRRAAAGWALRRAERIIAVSQPLADRAHELSVPRDRIAVIGNGVDTDRFRPIDPSEARRRLGLPQQGRLMVSVGHLSSRKGFQRVLRLMPGLLRRYPDLTFAIVGGPGAEGNIRGQLELLVSELALEEHVMLVGTKPPAEVALWMSAADLFVLASELEGSPNVVWEALACGCPIVATDVGDLRHLVPDYAGIVCGPASDEARLDASLCAGLARAWNRARIRAFAEGRTWEAVAARVLEQWRLATERLPLLPAAR